MKKVRLWEISIWFRESSNKYNKLLIQSQLSSLVNNARIIGRFETDKMYRLNVSIYPISDRNLFPDIDITKMETTYRIGHDMINSMLAFIDLDEVLTINDQTQRLQYLSLWIQSVLRRYFDYNNIDSSNLINGFKQVQENNFFTYASKKYLNRNKSLEVWIEKRVHSDEQLFRLKIYNPTNEEVIVHYIISKKFNFVNNDELSKMSLDEKLKIVKYFTIDGWKKGNIFHFQWGEEEKYEFRANEMKLYLNGKEVNGE